MLKRLPSWIWFAAWLLAFVAGTINVLGLLGFAHQALTHMTGLTSQLGAAIADGDMHGINRVVAVMAAFVSGAFCSGLLIEDEEFHKNSRYGVALFVEAMLLFVATFCLYQGFTIGFYIASFACGLQNAMVTSLSASIIRTTHVSGMFTDLGIALAHILRGLEIDRRRVRICLSTICGFCLGGIASAMLYSHFELMTLLLPATLTLGMSYFHRRLGQRQS